MSIPGDRVMGEKGIQSKGPVCVQPAHLGNGKQMTEGTDGAGEVPTGTQEGCLRLRGVSRMQGFQFENQDASITLGRCMGRRNERDLSIHAAS